MKNKLKKLLVLANIGKNQRFNFHSDKYFYYNGLRATFEKSLNYISGGRALDIGAGFGNEVKALLKKGFTVSATDPNPEAIRFLNKLAKRTNRLEVYQESLPTISAAGKFNLIVCEMVLHFLEREEILDSVKQMQVKTADGGMNVISAYVDAKPLNTDKEMKGYFTYLLPEKELGELYSGWEIIHYEESYNARSFKSVKMIARKKA